MATEGNWITEDSDASRQVQRKELGHMRLQHFSMLNIQNLNEMTLQHVSTLNIQNLKEMALLCVSSKADWNLFNQI